MTVFSRSTRARSSDVRNATSPWTLRSLARQIRKRSAVDTLTGQVCNDCRRPTCKSCGRRPDEALEGNEYMFYTTQDEGQYVCANCRECSRECRLLVCSESLGCGKKLPVSAFPQNVQARVRERGGVTSVKALCSACKDKVDRVREQPRTCTECGQQKEKQDMARKPGRSSFLSRCNECVYPVCESCGQRAKEQVRAVDKMKTRKGGEEHIAWYPQI